jgi:ArsR family transcriptional regulator
LAAPAEMAKRSRKVPAASSRTKSASWNARARLLRVVAHPVRLMILEALSQSSRCVKDLNSLAAVSQPHLSQHMAALRRAKLVDCHSSGTLRCYYVLRPSLVRELVSLLSAEHPIKSRDRSQVVREAGRPGSPAKKKKAGSSSRRRKKTPPRFQRP